jgi:DNA-binding FrmR family transcriptional regulator
MIFQKKKEIEVSAELVGRHFNLHPKDKQSAITSLNRIIGQLETIKKDVETDNACDDTLVQILAIKGGVESMGRNLIGKGIFDNIESYSKSELEIIVKNLFKLD